MTFRYARKCLGDMSVALICDCANDIVYRAFLGFFVNPDALCQISNGDAHICLQRDTRYKARKQRRESVRNPGDSGEKFGRGFGGTKCLSGTTVIPIGIARPRFTIWSKWLLANSLMFLVLNYNLQCRNRMTTLRDATIISSLVMADTYCRPQAQRCRLDISSRECMMAYIL